MRTRTKRPASTKRPTKPAAKVPAIAPTGAAPVVPGRPSILDLKRSQFRAILISESAIAIRQELDRLAELIKPHGLDASEVGAIEREVWTQATGAIDPVELIPLWFVERSVYLKQSEADGAAAVLTRLRRKPVAVESINVVRPRASS